MAIFDKFKKLNVAHRKTDEALYSAVAQEMEDGVRHNGLWLKALEQAEGNKEKQIAEYIKLRAQSLKDDISINSIRAIQIMVSPTDVILRNLSRC